MFWKKKKPAVDYRSNIIAYEELVEGFFSELKRGMAAAELDIFNAKLNVPNPHTHFENMCRVYREIFLQQAKRHNYPMNVKTALYKMSNGCASIYRGKIEDKAFYDHLNSGGLAAAALLVAGVENGDFYNNPYDSSNDQLRAKSYEVALKLHQSDDIDENLLIGSNRDYWE